MKKAIITFGFVIALSAAAVFRAATDSEAAIKTQTVEYRHGKTTLEGYLAYDDANIGTRPGILVAHEWTGLGEYAKMRANMLAEMGYVAFAVDMNGKGIRAKDHAEAAKLSGIYRSDRKLMRERILAGLDELRKNKFVDQKMIAAVGYCFGGTSALELARSGADIKGVVSFHGGLDTPTPNDAKNIKGKILVCQGANDNFTSAGIAGFEDEMRKAGVDWQMNTYANAVHSFTVREAGLDPSKGMAYNEKADARSWQAMKNFFAEIFE